MKKQTLNPKRIQILTQLTNDLWVCLANLRENKGHDDCLPYQADIYVMDRKLVKTSPDKKIHFIKIGEIWNDGWGGDSNLTILNSEYAEKIRQEVAKHQMYWNGQPFGEYDFTTLCDEMATIWVDYFNANPKDADYTFVYLMDDEPSVKAYGSQILRFTTRKFAYND